MSLLWFVLACDTPNATPPQPADLTARGDTACSNDDDCIITHNPCFVDATCTHLDDAPATPDVLCDPPDYATPSADSCTCQTVCVAL